MHNFFKKLNSFCSIVSITTNASGARFSVVYKPKRTISGISGFRRWPNWYFEPVWSGFNFPSLGNRRNALMRSAGTHYNLLLLELLTFPKNANLGLQQVAWVVLRLRPSFSITLCIVIWVRKSNRLLTLELFPKIKVSSYLPFKLCSKRDLVINREEWKAHHWVYSQIHKNAFEIVLFERMFKGTAHRKCIGENLSYMYTARNPM